MKLQRLLAWSNTIIIVKDNTERIDAVTLKYLLLRITCNCRKGQFLFKKLLRVIKPISR